MNTNKKNSNEKISFESILDKMMVLIMSIIAALLVLAQNII
jgi:uncharacterized membrane protein